MKWGTLSHEKRSRLTSWAILLTGIVMAVPIYLFNAAPGTESAIASQDSKQYLREMEVYGGKANLMAGEIRGWFDGLWHGRTLAFTILALALLLALIVRIATTPLPPEGSRSESPREEGPRGP